jgi:hypothetical protein
MVLHVWKESWKLDNLLTVRKGVSDLKARLDYCEDPTRSCENLNFCFPAQTDPFY